MATTLSKGYITPTNGDKVTFWDQLNANFTRLNNHVHDGSDSQQLPLSALTRLTSTAPAANWVASGAPSPWKQTITLPTTLSFDTTQIEIRDSTGDRIFTKIVKLTSTTFDIYVNDNSLTLTVLYG